MENEKWVEQKWQNYKCFDYNENKVLKNVFEIWNFKTEGGMVVVLYFAPVCVKGSVAYVYLQICDQTSQITLRHFPSFCGHVRQKGKLCFDKETILNQTNHYFVFV